VRLNITAPPRQPVFVYSIASINVILWILLEVYGNSTNPSSLRKFGAIDSYLIWSGEYWRLVSAIFLHVGASHLAINSISLVIMGGLTERLYGHRNFISIFLVTGVMGSTVSYINIENGVVAAGASGAIFGCLGSLVSFFYIRKKAFGKSGKQTLNGLIILALVNLAFGFVFPAVDNWAHIGGFIAGLSSGYFLAHHPRTTQPSHRLKIPDIGQKVRLLLLIFFAVSITISVLAIDNAMYEPTKVFPVF
jgi:rhomboid protease GluP